jgi:hypothetical protein
LDPIKLSCYIHVYTSEKTFLIDAISFFYVYFYVDFIFLCIFLCRFLNVKSGDINISKTTSKLTIFYSNILFTLHKTTYIIYYIQVYSERGQRYIEEWNRINEESLFRCIYMYITRQFNWILLNLTSAVRTCRFIVAWNRFASTNKTDRHDITELLLKVALNTITLSITHEHKRRQTGENHRPVPSHWQTLSHNVVHLALIEIRTHNISDDSDVKLQKS